MKEEMNPQPVIALVGPPNAGKTTLFNYLSGKNLKTVNYPGSTIEYHVSEINARFNCNGLLLDSPGIVSLIPNSPDEEVTVNSIFSHPKYGEPDIVIVTLDSSQLSRHLLLLKELHSANFKVIAALTMGDVLAEKGLMIDDKTLTELSGIDAVNIDARNGKGIDKLISVIRKKLKSEKRIPRKENIEIWRDVKYLIEAYRNIEEIENKVIVPIRKVDNKSLEKADAKLSVIQPEISDEAKILPTQKTLRMDKVLLHPVWGLVIFFLVMAITFTSIFWAAVPLMDLVDLGFAALNNLVINIWGHTWLTDLVADGIINGTGAVAIFVPQIMILFLILGFLEDTGYLARSAMLIDKPLSKIGLNGRSFVPLLSGFACAVPAMLAARTIANRRERMITIFIIPLISCSARLPVYILLLSFLTPRGELWIAGLGLAAIYIFSIAISLTVAAIINKMNKKIIRAEDNSSFIIELPSYKMPKFSVVMHNTYLSTKEYINKAGPVILTFSIILWFLTYFPNIHPDVQKDNLSKKESSQLVVSERLESSYAADLGKVIEPVMKPLGLDWRVGVSLITTFAAREVFVSSMALIFKVTEKEERLQHSIITAMRKATINGTNEKLFTPSKIIGLIVFFIFALQCISTIAVSRKETGSWRIPLLQLTIYSSVAYILAFITIHGLQFLGIP
jgi:ferrous iron transport protein B